MESMPLTNTLIQTGQCPKCTVPLMPQALEEGNVGHCAACNGVWVSVLEEKEVLQIMPMVFAVEELRRFRLLYKPAQFPRDTRYVPCPDCGQLMNRKVWGSHSGVIVDVCRDHGTWFDDGELEQVREYVKLGGVEYEKLRLIENGLAQLGLKMEHAFRQFGPRPYTHSR